MKIPSLLLVVSLLSCGLHAADKDKPAAPEAKAASSAKKTVKNVGAEEFAKLREAKTNVVLDVRTPEEFEAGHIPGAILIDFTSPDFQEKVAELDKSKTYLVYCASGGRSARACKKMDALHIGPLYNLEGGFIAWKKEAKPVEK